MDPETEKQIDQKLEAHDKDIKAYIDMKMRSIKNNLKIFIWMEKHPWQSLVILLVFLSVMVTLALMIDIKKTTEELTPIEFKTEQP